jgi:hypothetical protein
MRGRKMKRHTFIAVGLTELNHIASDSVTDFRRMLDKLIQSYGAGQDVFATVVKAWDGKSTIEALTDGGSGQSGDIWVIGLWSDVLEHDLVSDAWDEFKSFDILSEEDLDRAIGVARTES